MAAKTVIDAVRDKLASDWSGATVLNGATTAEAPGDGSSFVVLQFPVANVERMTVNERRYRETGAFRFVIATRRALGEDAAADIADALAALFRDRRFGGIRTQVPGSITFDDDTDDGLYNRTSFAVPYTFNFTVPE